MDRKPTIRRECRKSVEGYKTIADPKAGELPHYLLLLYYKIIERSLLKHSKRPSSEIVNHSCSTMAHSNAMYTIQVMQWWSETNF